MQTEFVTYEQAIELKKLGFAEPCFSFYSKDSDVLYFDVDPDDHTLEWYNQSSVDIRNFSWVYRTSAPLKQQVFRWFRENHKFDGWATPCYTSDGKFYSFIIENGKESEIDGSYDDFKTYEEAESACIDKLIEIIILNPALK